MILPDHAGGDVKGCRMLGTEQMLEEKGEGMNDEIQD